MALFSNSKVDKAGRALRAWVVAGREPADAPNDALVVMRQQIRSHLAPQLVAVRSLWGAVGACESPQGAPLGNVSDRLKSEERLLHKLSREKPTRLSQIQDIAGCRLELVRQPGGLDLLQVVCECLKRDVDLKVVKVRDYISVPRDTGYRAIHVIGKVHGYSVEI